MIRFACRLTRPNFTFDAAFDAGPGITALFGPSGAGKSTAVRLIAGVDKPDEGRIAIDDSVLIDTSAGVAMPPHRRRVGLVFQDALLLPHLSVKANLTFGRWFTPSAEQRIGFDSVVDVLGVGQLLTRRPGTLSGGERQRVAIGRALLASPRLLLMDEPLASLDASRKQEILPFVERLPREFAIPIIYVSHSIEEVSRLASTVVTLHGGRVVATGSPAEVLPLPPQATAPTQTDLGARHHLTSLLSAVVERHMPEYGLAMLRHPAGTIVASVEAAAGEEVSVGIRAASVTLSLKRSDFARLRTSLSGKVSAIEIDDGPYVLVTIALAGGDALKASTTRLAIDGMTLAVGDDVHAQVADASL
jgi:molybdate transport system ATP-binding protein